MTGAASGLTLDRVPGRLAVARLAPNAPLPDWAASGTGFLSVTRTDEELSVVAEESLVPPGEVAEREWAAHRVRGPLPFHLTGILASLAGPLASAGIPIFVISTYDTDYLLVKEDRLEEAIRTLIAAGHQVQ